jgi:acyl-CoA-binding protein
MTEKFEKAIELVKKLKQVNDEDKLILYSYYKQAKFGDINIEKPSILNIECKVLTKASSS